MAKLLDRIKSLFHDRRHGSATVDQDRRVPRTLKAADDHLQEAMEKLERTTRLRREDFYDRIK